MKQHPLIIFILILSTSCSVKEQDNTKDKLYTLLLFNKTETGKIAITQDTANSTVKLPAELLKSLNTSSATCEFCYDNFKTDSTYRINYETENSIYPFQFTDINFDGFSDFGFPSKSTCCSGNNVINEIWLFDQKRSDFTYSKTLSEIPIWALQPEKKQIESGWHMGVNDFGKFTYQWKGDSLTLIEEFRSETLNDSIIIEVNKRLDRNSWVQDTTVRKY